MSEEFKDQQLTIEMPDAESLSSLLPGQKLKKIRLEWKLDRAEVAEKLHMTVTYIKALEDGDYQKLPGKTFVKGYFRIYADFLKTNVDDILLSYTKHAATLEAGEKAEAKGIQERKNLDQNFRWLIATGIIIVALLSLGWWFNYA